MVLVNAPWLWTLGIIRSFRKCSPSALQMQCRLEHVPNDAYFHPIPIPVPVPFHSIPFCILMGEGTPKKDTKYINGSLKENSNADI